MEVRPLSPVAFDNRNAGIPRHALDMLRGYNDEATRAARNARQEIDDSGLTVQDSYGGSTRPESQDEFARRMGFVGIFVDVYV